jgi:hypothetical protein
LNESSDFHQTNVGRTKVAAMALQFAMLLLRRRCYCNAIVAAALLLQCCCYNGAAALRLNFYFFFLLDNFKKEIENEKEKNE